ncbi:MAG: zinc-ribbon domain containing protein, partial [Clostridia bacterium]|nr:zinc-ribbon domain containing protein [Clostridia bacterium]
MRRGQKNTIFLKRGKEMYEDKTLKCKECGQDFVFTA